LILSAIWFGLGMRFTCDDPDDIGIGDRGGCGTDSWSHSGGTSEWTFMCQNKDVARTGRKTGDRTSRLMRGSLPETRTRREFS
jgi:hypothetical protein